MNNARILVCLLAIAGAGRADTVQLTADVVLSGAASLSYQNITLDGQGYQISSTPDWTGTLTLIGCQITGLGSASRQGILIQGTGTVTLTGDTWSASGFVEVQSNGTTVQNCWYNSECLNPISSDGITAGANEPAFRLVGSGGTFSGNTVLRGWVEVGPGGWQVTNNVVSGFRGGLVGGGDSTAYGNYFHADLTVDATNYPWWGDVFNVAGGFTAFHDNVTDSGHWPWRIISGPFHDNLVVNAHGGSSSAFVQIGTATIYHNIFAHRDYHLDRWGSTYDPVVLAFINQTDTYGSDSFTVYHNVFDGRGTDADHPAATWGAYVVSGSTMPEFDNNVLYQVPNTWTGTITDVTGNFLGDPGFAGPLPNAFPWTSADFVAGTITVSQALTYYRSVYGYPGQ